MFLLLIRLFISFQGVCCVFHNVTATLAFSQSECKTVLMTRISRRQ